MEKRAYPRETFQVGARLREDGRELSGEIQNLSLRGMFVTTDRTLAVGEPVEVTIRLRDEDPPVVIRIDAEVVWTNERGAGIEFEEMGIDSAGRLYELIHGCRSAAAVKVTPKVPPKS